jgi:hypothetical protein
LLTGKAAGIRRPFSLGDRRVLRPVEELAHTVRAMLDG